MLNSEHFLLWAAIENYEAKGQRKEQEQNKTNFKVFIDFLQTIAFQGFIQ